MTQKENKQNELTMLVNKENQDVFLAVPNVVEGERYFIISGHDFPQEYHIGDIYLPKEKWLKKTYKFDEWKWLKSTIGNTRPVCESELNPYKELLGHTTQDIDKLE